MRTYYVGLSIAAATAAGLANLSCSAVECGPGTIERDGLCAPAEQITEPAGCGGVGPFATVLGLDGLCEAETPTVCDEDTTEEVTDMDTGVTTCIGTGGGCGTPVRCDPPDANRATLCGQIYDTGSDTPIAAAAVNPTGECPATRPDDGPCSLRVRFFDAVDFASNPSGAMPLTPEGGVYQDGCGRYRGHNMQRATLGFIGIGVDDATATPAVQHRLTGVATANELANPGRDFRAYATTVATDQAWTSSAGLTGMSFAERGVLAIVFHYKGVPQAGVMARRNGALIPDDDFYFSDTGIARTTVDPAQTSTGMNGTALVIDVPSPTAHDGIGGEPAGCRWPSNLAAAIPTVVFVQIKEAETPAGAACP
ncbi:MAG: hypothetical protein F9K40_07540 [Kofleriaceae bacterium]|nr:MAG: hypothetical protein F9K40_07540 [Kofleriaceae bacterium]MBZ0237510.1 hypothetical protein [Kofleriaceae bacterium]